MVHCKTPKRCFEKPNILTKRNFHRIFENESKEVHFTKVTTIYSIM